MAKRKAEAPVQSASPAKKLAAETGGRTAFAPALFEDDKLERYRTEYATSTPYKHTVVSPLISDDLLRNVRSEIIEHVDFTPKETDIYKIHQSGDLANLSGLPASALQKLPSLLLLRDALYGRDFRTWISTVAGSGPLSGRKTDMAINVYVPGCHLLCHDDVIGTRRVSYILYLTDPDKPWQADWGGALRLYATDEVKDEDKRAFKLPQSSWVKSIPPAWNQLSFFTVQPGESFHDVEEVYRPAGNSESDATRVRMAISGWFHIPQEGEEGYQPGLEATLAEKSSLAQLQGKADQLDRPQMLWHSPTPVADDSQSDLTEADLQLLLQYMTPNYLTPDTVEELNDIFSDESTLQLTDFLSNNFAARLREQLSVEKPVFNQTWHTSRPPHKHRYQYMQVNAPPVQETAYAEQDPYSALLTHLLPSAAFAKWLALVSGLSFGQCAAIGRHFRRGLDYQLAQEYTADQPQLEYTLCVTPSSGWTAEAEAEDATSDEQEDNVGGYELYMAGDDEGDGDHVNISNGHASMSSTTGAGHRRSATKADPAVYKAATDDEDDGILFSNPASWNTLSLVLRDKGVLRFVKYVSRAAQGDRWDLSGAYTVIDDGESDSNNDGAVAGFEGFND